METSHTVRIADLQNDDDISLKELILKIKGWYDYLRSRWLIIIIAIIVGSGLGFVYISSKKPLYTASCTFVLEDGTSGSSVGQYSGIASMVGIDLGNGGGGIFQGDNIIELYKSRTMIEKALLSEGVFDNKNQLLIDRYIAFNRLRQSWSQDAMLANINFNLPREQYGRLQDSILGAVVRDINKNYLNVMKPDKKLSIIKVEVKAYDEDFAKLFNDQIVKKVNDFYVQTKTKKSLDNVTMLQQKTDSVRAVINGAVYRAVAISDAMPNPNATRQVHRVAPIQRAQISVETNKIILGELLKNLELSKISLRQETPLIQVVDKPVFPLEKEKLSKGKGAVFGGIFAGMFVVVILLIKRVIKSIMA